jgi:hypothetical protein
MKRLIGLLLGFGLFFFSGCSNEVTNEQDVSTDQHETAEVETDEMEVLDTVDMHTESPEEEAVEESACETNVFAYVSDPGEEVTNIRNAPGGEVVLELQVGGFDDEYMLELDQCQNGWFHIKGNVNRIEEDLEIPGGEGWIHHSVISADTRNYGDQPIHFYEAPGENAGINGTLKHESGGLKIYEACGEWVRCSYENESTGEKYAGWIKTEWLCGNPFTNCS